MTAQNIQITYLPYGVSLPERQIVLDAGKSREVKRYAKNVYSKSIVAHVINLFKAPVL